MTARDWKKPAFAKRLHVLNESSVMGRPTTGRFRLVAAIGVVKSVSRAPDGTTRQKLEIPFKLFEVVEGAVLVVEAEAGSEVWAEIQLVSQEVPAMTYRTLATAGPEGVARLRVPYATRQGGAIATPGPWWVHAGDRKIPFAVDEADVREGREVHAPVDPEPAAS